MTEVVLQLSEDAAEFLHDQVAAGAAASPSEVVERAVAELQKREAAYERKKARLMAAIREGEDAIQRGEYEDVPYDQLEEWFARLRVERD